MKEEMIHQMDQKNISFFDKDQINWYEHRNKYQTDRLQILVIANLSWTRLVKINYKITVIFSLK